MKKNFYWIFIGFLLGALVFIPTVHYWTANKYVDGLERDQDQLWAEIYFTTQDKHQLYLNTVELINEFEKLDEEIELIRIWRYGQLESQINLEVSK